MLSMGRRGNGKTTSTPTPPEPPSDPGRRLARPRDPASDQHALGNVTLQAVDQLTGITATEIEKLADQLMTAAEDVARTLGECARRIRQNGVIANERLSAFVTVANTCAEAARVMQGKIETRDEQPPEPMKPLPFEQQQVTPVEPHDYVPSTMHQGDCAVCGHIQDAPIHQVTHQTDLKALAAQIGVKED